MTASIRPLDVTNSRDVECSLDLFKLVYGHDMSAAFYRWRFTDNPFGPTMVSLLWDGDVLAGHYAVAPTRASIHGRPYLAAQSMTTMTHPEYRNRGIFTDLAQDLYSRIADMGVVLVWGLPNIQSHYGFTQKLQWRDVTIVTTMTCTLARQSRPEVPIDTGREVGSWLDALFARSADDRILPSIKNEAYFRWRYISCPHHTYRFFSLPGSDDVVIVGKEYRTPRGKALELVDYLYAHNTPAFGEALDGVMGWARQHEYALVRTWMPLNEPAFRELERRAFVPSEPLAYFGARPLGSLELADSCWDARAWCITMGNSDNY